MTGNKGGNRRTAVLYCLGTRLYRRRLITITWWRTHHFAFLLVNVCEQAKRITSGRAVTAMRNGRSLTIDHPAIFAQPRREDNPVGKTVLSRSADTFASADLGPGQQPRLERLKRSLREPAVTFARGTCSVVST
jgi:hypothetical protein